jgi:hypothetical protein
MRFAPFGNPATSSEKRPVSFASPPLDGFALVVDLRHHNHGTNRPPRQDANYHPAPFASGFSSCSLPYPVHHYG